MFLIFLTIWIAAISVVLLFLCQWCGSINEKYSGLTVEIRHIRDRLVACNKEIAQIKAGGGKDV